MCAAGWTGPTCDQGRYLCLSVCLFVCLSACDGSPCQNGARCFDYNNGYLCMCAAGWTGPTCDQGRYLCLSVCLSVCLPVTVAYVRMALDGF